MCIVQLIECNRTRVFHSVNKADESNLKKNLLLVNSDVKKSESDDWCVPAKLHDIDKSGKIEQEP